MPVRKPSPNNSRSFSRVTTSNRRTTIIKRTINNSFSGTSSISIKSSDRETQLALLNKKNFPSPTVAVIQKNNSLLRHRRRQQQQRLLPAARTIAARISANNNGGCSSNSIISSSNCTFLIRIKWFSFPGLRTRQWINQSQWIWFGKTRRRYSHNSCQSSVVSQSVSSVLGTLQELRSKEATTRGKS